VTGPRLTVEECVVPVAIRELSVFHVNLRVPKVAYREGAVRRADPLDGGLPANESVLHTHAILELS